MKPKKKRKRASLESRKNNQSSGYWQSKADRLWSKTVRRNWGYKCAICGEPDVKKLQAHHLISKKGGGAIFRYDPKIGVCLCVRHHGKWGAYNSAHSGHLAFSFWLHDLHLEIWEYVRTNIQRVSHTGPYPNINYKEAYEELLKNAHPDDV